MQRRTRVLTGYLSWFLHSCLGWRVSPHRLGRVWAFQAILIQDYPRKNIRACIPANVTFCQPCNAHRLDRIGGCSSASGFHARPRPPSGSLCAGPSRPTRGCVLDRGGTEPCCEAALCCDSIRWLRRVRLHEANRLCTTLCRQGGARGRSLRVHCRLEGGV